MENNDWNDGYWEGRHGVLIELCDRIQKRLWDISSIVGSVPLETTSLALLELSSIYSFLCGSEELFWSYLKFGRMLSEPEIRFARVATEEEQEMSFKDLWNRWTDSNYEKF